MQPYIHIAPIERLRDAHLLAPLSRHLERVFGLKTLAAPLRVTLARAFDPARNQYDSGALLLQVLETAPPEAAKVLALTDVDIFVPVLTFLFGEAQYDGRAAIVSLCRLDPAFYGATADKALLLERLLKEATHELGHAFGLVHCYYPGCVMNSSSDVDGVDARPLSFCERCGETLSRKIASQGGRVS